MQTNSTYLSQNMYKAGTLSEQWRETPDKTSMQAASDCAINEYE